MWIWDRIRGLGGSREAEADEQEEFGAPDEGGADERYLAETGFGGSTGLAGRDAADVADADLRDFEPPSDPAP